MKDLILASLSLSLFLCSAGCSGGGSSRGGSTSTSAPAPTGGPTSASNSGGTTHHAPPADPLPAASPAPIQSATAPSNAQSASEEVVSVEINSPPTASFVDADIPAGFRYATLRRVRFRVSAADAEGNPVAGALLGVRADGVIVYRGRVTGAGTLQAGADVPANSLTLRFELATVGIANDLSVPVADDVEVSFGYAELLPRAEWLPSLR
jgi:hypothetical protein